MNENEIKNRMNNSLEVFKSNISGIRAGRASPEILANINIEAYGDHMPLNQLASISSIDSTTLSVQVWDSNFVDNIDKAIRSSELNLNPIKDGNSLKVPFPQLSEERRKEYVKLCSNYLEQAKISLRNIRRDENDKIKKLEKSGDISEDEMHGNQDSIQKILDQFIKNLDDIFEKKQKEILSI